MSDASTEPQFCVEPYIEPVNGKVQPPTSRSIDNLGRHTNLLQFLYEHVLYYVFHHRSAWPFRLPVDAEKLKLPDYHRIIRHPMDLRTIRKRLENRYYWSAKHCLHDFQTIFRNCYTYNKPSDDVVVMARELEIVYLTKLAEMPKEEFVVDPRTSSFAVSSSWTLAGAVGDSSADTQDPSAISADRNIISVPPQATTASGAAPLTATTSSSTATTSSINNDHVTMPTIVAASFLRYPISSHGNNLAFSGNVPPPSQPGENTTRDPQNLSVEDVGRVRCSTCDRYLSYAPITVDIKGAARCGRCFSSAEKPLERNTMYEILANYVAFSCIFDFLGCTQKIKFCDVPHHEATCEFRVEPCPVRNCRAIACLNKMQAHFVKHHPHLVAEDSRFQITREELISGTKILNLDGQNVLLQIRPTRASNVERDLAFAFFNKDPNTENFKYSLKIFSTAGPKSFKMDVHPIGLYHPLWNYDKQAIISLNLNALQSLLGCEELTFELLVDKSLKLECNICTVPMKPPIFICKTGHSICSSCRSKVTICPTCRAKYGSTRNFQLEELAGQMSQFECVLVDKQR